MNVGKPEVLAVSLNGVAHTVAGEAGAFLVTETGIVAAE